MDGSASDMECAKLLALRYGPALDIGEVFSKFAKVCSDEWALVGVMNTPYGVGVYYLNEAHGSDDMPMEALNS